MMHSIKPKTALISLSDKTGLEELINFLVSENVKILSTGGTYKAIKEITSEVIEVSDFTGFEEMMNGRVKTLHPKIHAGILARRDQDLEVLEERGYEPIDLVVVNLYPFKETIAEDCSFDEAIELAFYGAKVIHPKTIQPLKQKNIPLRIKSFIKPEAEGSIVKSKIDKMSDMPSFIVKENQILISISDVDLSFIVGNHMNQIFSLLAKNNVEVNLMQNSAVSFSICVDNDLHKIPQLIKDLQQFYEVLYNADLSLFTLRNYNDSSFDSFLQDKDVILEQKSRNTIQFIAR